MYSAYREDRLCVFDTLMHCHGDLTIRVSIQLALYQYCGAYAAVDRTQFEYKNAALKSLFLNVCVRARDLCVTEHVCVREVQ